MRTERHGYHLVDNSPSPLIVSIGVLVITSGGVMYMHNYDRGGMVLSVGIIYTIIGIIYWLREIVREGTYEGQHTKMVSKGIKLGFMLFIVSEVMFFVTFFFSYFWMSLGVSDSVGGVYPAIGIETVDAYKIPLLNTLILLLSGGTMTYAHHALIVEKREEALRGMIITIGLAILFTAFQMYEYIEGKFSISDSIYGSNFYLLTGFHGAHVILGTIMLIVSMYRIYNYEMTSKKHVGFEVSAYYYHFVDVVWLGLFVIVYVYGS